MAIVECIAPFFSLPLELREQIYKNTFSFSAQGSDLLRTCHEIHKEARKFLYRRPLSFRSQDLFHTWLAAAPSDLLDQVSDISLSVQDVDLRPILTSEPSMQRPRTPPSLMTWDLYQAELDRLKQALERVPKVKTIALRALPCQHSFLYREFMTRILDMLGQAYPDLHDLRLDGNFHNQELAFLSKLSRLKSFSFDGFSASSPAATANILSNLKLLRNLSLFPQHAMLTPTAGLHSGFTTKRLSFTGDVMRTIGQLASFTVSERTTMASPTLFFTSEILSSLHEHKTLKSLSINLSHSPHAGSLESLETFLDKSSIERLELDWPDLRPVVLERHKLLTGSLKVLWVRVKTEADAFDILWSIGECREVGQLRKLEKVVLIRSTEDFDNVLNVACDRKDSGVGGLDYEARHVGDLYIRSRDYACP